MGQPAQRAVVVGTGPDADAAAALLHADGWVVDHQTGATPTHPGASLLVVDEWTAETAPHVVAARRAGSRVTVLAELILERTPRSVVAVTGTAGKTTTARLLATILTHARREPLITPDGRAANAWPNASLVEPALHDGDMLVAELTSTHLCYMDGWTGPDVAVVTNLWPDHVELHGSLAAYVAAKQRILRRRDRPVAVNADDAAGQALLGPPASSDVAWFSQCAPVPHGAWIQDGRLHIRWDGVHQDVWAVDHTSGWMHPTAVVAAAAAAMWCGAGSEAIAAGVAAAEQLPHRFHDLGEVAGIRVIDDAMAATPVKASAAISRCDLETLVVLVGGDAQVDGRVVHADPAADAALRQAITLASGAAHLIGFGTAGALVADQCPATIRVPTLTDAITVAAQRARAGDTILLAPMFPMAQSDRVIFAGRMRHMIADT